MKIILALAIALAPAPALANTPPDFLCWMDFGGKIINLEALCTPAKPAPRIVSKRPAPPAAPAGPTDAQLVNLGQHLWARAYCQAREDGKGKTSAEAAGFEAVNDWLLGDAINLWGSGRILAFSEGPLDKVLAGGPARASQYCP